MFLLFIILLIFVILLKSRKKYSDNSKNMEKICKYFSIYQPFKNKDTVCNNIMNRSPIGKAFNSADLCL